MLSPYFISQNFLDLFKLPFSTIHPSVRHTRVKLLQESKTKVKKEGEQEERKKEKEKKGKKEKKEEKGKKKEKREKKWRKEKEEEKRGRKG